MQRINNKRCMEILMKFQNSKNKNILSIQNVLVLRRYKIKFLGVKYL